MWLQINKVHINRTQDDRRAKATQLQRKKQLGIPGNSKIINKTSEDGKWVCSNPSMSWKRKRRLKTGNDFSASLITRSLLISSCYRHNPPPHHANFSTGSSGQYDVRLRRCNCQCQPADTCWCILQLELTISDGS